MRIYDDKRFRRTCRFWIDPVVKTDRRGLFSHFRLGSYGSFIMTHVPIIIDVEASGFGRGSYPIEIGLALEHGDTMQLLVRPEPDWVHWEAEAAALHGIDRDHLLEAGTDVREVARILNDRLAGETVYSNAWGHDVTWIALLFDAADTLQAFRIEALETLVGEDMREAWLAAREKTLASMAGQPHRADVDALNLQTTYLRMKGLAGNPPTDQGATKKRALRTSSSPRVSGFRDGP